MKTHYDHRGRLFLTPKCMLKMGNSQRMRAVGVSKLKLKTNMFSTCPFIYLINSQLSYANNMSLDIRML